MLKLSADTERMWEAKYLFTIELYGFIFWFAFEVKVFLSSKPTHKNWFKESLAYENYKKTCHFEFYRLSVMQKPQYNEYLIHQLFRDTSTLKGKVVILVLRPKLDCIGILLLLIYRAFIVLLVIPAVHKRLQSMVTSKADFFSSKVGNNEKKPFIVFLPLSGHILKVRKLKLNIQNNSFIVFKIRPTQLRGR